MTKYLLCLFFVGCAADTADNTGAGAAGSVAVAVEPLTTSYTVPNYNGCAVCQAMSNQCLLNMWVMQYTNPQRWQCTEWDCRNGQCSSNYGLPTWSLGAAESGGRIALLKNGNRVGWASSVRCTQALCGTTSGWYAQYNADNRSANGSGAFSGNPKLTVVR